MYPAVEVCASDPVALLFPSGSSSNILQGFLLALFEINIPSPPRFYLTRHRASSRADSTEYFTNKIVFLRLLRPDVTKTRYFKVKNRRVFRFIRDFRNGNGENETGGKIKLEKKQKWNYEIRDDVEKFANFVSWRDIDQTGPAKPMKIKIFHLQMNVRSSGSAKQRLPAVLVSPWN